MTTSPFVPLTPSGDSTAREDVLHELSTALSAASLQEESVFGAGKRKGGRFLTGDKDVWDYNAWDDVDWSEEQLKAASDAKIRQIENPVPLDAATKINATPEKFWNRFYSNVQDKFFKDRSWLQAEFPELQAASKADAGPITIAELGCGVGNSAFPTLTASQNPHLFIHALDYSEKAISILKTNELYDETRCKAQVWDLSSSDGPPPDIAPGSVDIITMIFVLSALHPDEHSQAIKNVLTMLKPGGVVLFRDYGENDLCQLRFKSNRFLSENFYARGDNTRVYFFKKDQLRDLFGKCEVLAIGEDRRLLVNRKRKLQMFRVWLQGRFQKPLE